MTRINIFPVEQLHSKFLLAEHREIKRIPNQILSGRYNLDGIPKHYTMGTGHVKYFYNKLKFLHLRYIDLYNECLRRGYNVMNYEKSFIRLSEELETTTYNKLYNDYKPSFDAMVISQERINQKLAMKPEFYS